MSIGFFIESNGDAGPYALLSSLTPIADRFLNIGHPVKTGGAVWPGDVAPVVAPAPNGATSMYAMMWGIDIPGTDRPVSSVMIEDAVEDETFRQDWAHHRCVIPVTSYIACKRDAGREWLEVKPKGKSISWVCGIYKILDGFPYFAVLLSECLCERPGLKWNMPVMIPENRINEWVNPFADPGGLIKFAIKELEVEEKNECGNSIYFT